MLKLNDVTWLYQHLPMRFTLDVARGERIAEGCDAGGVGFYGRSNFVHMDCGPVRTWNG